MKPHLPAALFLALIISATSARADTYFVSYISTNTIEEFSSTGTDLGPFVSGLDEPQGIAFDAQGNLYVLNSGNATIEKYSSTGADLGKFVSTGLSNPVDLIFDSAGYLYVSNYSNGAIVRFSPAGANLGTFASTGTGAWGLAFDSGGNLCVSDQENGNVQKFSPTGASLGTFVSTNLSAPTGIAFDLTGNLYVSNIGSNSVQIYSPTGTNLGQVAVSGLSNPTGLFFDSGGNLFISNTNNNQLIKVSPAGVNLGIFATTGSGRPVFMIVQPPPPTPTAAAITVQPAPLSVIAGAKAAFAVGASGYPLPAVQWQTSLDGGATWTNLSDGGNISGSATTILSFSNTTASMSGNQFRAIVSNSGATLTTNAVTLTIAVPPAITTQPLAQTVGSGNPASFTVAANGTSPSFQWQISTNGGSTWANLTSTGVISGATSATLKISPAIGTNSAQYRVIIINAVGSATSNSVSLTVLAPVPPPPGTFFVSYFSSNSIEEFSPSGTDLGAFVTGLNQPQGIAFDGQGNLYVTNSNSTIGRFSPTGVDLGPFAKTGLSNPIDLVFDSAGNLYVSNYGSGIIRKFSPTGADLGTFANAGSGPWGLAFDSGGNLCVSNQSSSTVQKFSPAGVNLGTFVSVNLNTPLGMAFDPSGNLYVSNSGSNTVQIYSPAGTNLGHVAVTGLNNPTGLFFDTAGNLYISDSSNNEIRKVSPTGTDLGIFATTGMGRPVFMIVQPTPAAAAITMQPTPFTVTAGATATFTVSASGYPIPTFQWQISTDGGSTWGNLTDGGNISGSATYTLSLSNTTAIMSGNQFRAVASNSVGPATSNPATLTVDTPPAITTQPGNQTVIAGNTTTFTAAASGNPAPAFQWQISSDGGATWGNLTDGANITGSTSATLSLSNTTATMLGNQFRAVATNSVGSLTTSPATLTVNIAPAITTQPGNETLTAGNSTTFTTAASGNPAPAFQWQISTDSGATWSNLTDGANISGSANTTLSLSNTTASMLGNQFRAVATNSLGSATSNAATLTVDTVPIITSQPANQTAVAGNTATFTTAASSFPNSTFQWQQSTDDGSTWANLTDGANISGSATATLSLSKVTAAMLDDQFRAIATNAAGMATTNAATLTVLFPPQITSQPVSVAVFSGNTATFSVTATGNPAPGYQWYFNGKFIAADAASATLTIANVTTAKVGNYTVVLANGIGRPVTSGIARLALGVVPRITIQPGNQTAALGQNAVFKVTISGNLPPSVQWQISIPGGAHNKNLVDDGTYSGVTSATLTISNTTAAQSGYQFRAIASNLIGTTTYTVISKPATLTIILPPVITALSAGNISSLSGGNQTIAVGGDFTFSVIATGAALKYQWQHNGKNIPGATKSVYNLANATSASAGAYRVVVTNTVKSVTSSNFVLTALTPPIITTQPKAQTVKAGANVTFKVVASTTSTTPLSYQWKYDGAPLTDGPNITGSTKASLKLDNVTSAANAGPYQVVITNAAGSLASASVKLTVQ